MIGHLLKVNLHLQFCGAGLGVLGSRILTREASVKNQHHRHHHIIIIDHHHHHATTTIITRGRLKKLSITLWCQLVVKALEEVDPAIVSWVFKICCEDSVLYEGDTDDPFAHIDNESADDFEMALII